MNGLGLWAGRMLNQHVINEIKSADLKLYVWTVNKPQKAKSLFDMRVDGITTDRAGWIKNQLESHNK
jgi:glycerophosphoryl diester phosphodiesterase